MEDRAKCDPSDLMCQIQVLSHLKGIKAILGDSRFRTELPDLADLSDLLPSRIVEQQKIVDAQLRTCGLSPDDVFPAENHTDIPPMDNENIS